jgi:hypothetical protein
MFPLNMILLLQVKRSYMFWLAKVAIIRLNVKTVERFITGINDLNSQNCKGNITVHE